MLSELRCNGDEKSLAECSHGGIGQHICSSHDRARIVCSNGMELICIAVVFILLSAYNY